LGSYWDHCGMDKRSKWQLAIFGVPSATQHIAKMHCASKMQLQLPASMGIMGELAPPGKRKTG